MNFYDILHNIINILLTQKSFQTFTEFYFTTHNNLNYFGEEEFSHTSHLIINLKKNWRSTDKNSKGLLLIQ